MSTNKYFWGHLVFRGMSFVSVFSKLLPYWKILLLEISEVGWTLTGTGRTHHCQPCLEPEPQVVVVLDCHKLRYVLRSKLWGYGGWKVNTWTEVFTVVSTYGGLAELGAAAAAYPCSALSPGSGTPTTSLATSYLCGKSPKASCRLLIAWWLYLGLCQKQCAQDLCPSAMKFWILLQNSDTNWGN